MTTVIDGTTGSSIAGNSTVVGNLSVGGAATVTGAINAASVSVPGGALITESITLLGTLTTTSGTTQTLSGLNLTGYRLVFISFSDLSGAGAGAGTKVSLNGTEITVSTGANGNSAWGICWIDLNNSVFTCTTGVAASGTNPTSTSPTGSPLTGVLGVSNSTTSLAFAITSGSAFDLGSIRVYGVK
jgi:hypothetical protein